MAFSTRGLYDHFGNETVVGILGKFVTYGKTILKTFFLYHQIRSDDTHFLFQSHHIASFNTVAEDSGQCAGNGNDFIVHPPPLPGRRSWSVYYKENAD